MQLIGLCRLGRDASLKTLESGQVLAELALVFDHRKGEPQWIDATLWGTRAEKLAQYLTKGKQVCVTLDGPHIKSYMKRDGQPGGTLIATVTAIEFASGKGGGSSGEPAETAPVPAPAKTPMQAIEDLDSDVPF